MISSGGWKRGFHRRPLGKLSKIWLYNPRVSDTLWGFLCAVHVAKTTCTYSIIWVRNHITTIFNIDENWLSGRPQNAPLDRNVPIKRKRSMNSSSITIRPIFDTIFGNILKSIYCGLKFSTRRKICISYEKNMYIYTRSFNSFYKYTYFLLVSI